MNQPGKECQRFDGKEGASPGWGEPRVRPFKGWAIRVFEWLNATWPHAGHTLYNGAQSATPLHDAAKCLSSFVPPHPDLLLLEPMSMGGVLRVDGVEGILRKLLSPANGVARPAVAFVNVPLWGREDVPSAYGPGSDGACQYNGETYERNVHLWGRAEQREQHAQPEIERQARTPVETPLAGRAQNTLKRATCKMSPSGDCSITLSRARLCSITLPTLHSRSMTLNRIQTAAWLHR